jgi:hypothetical protein
MSEKGLVNEVLTLTATEPKLQQLIDNVEKLKAQEAWHRRQSSKLFTEKAGLEKELSDIAAGEIAVEIGKQLKGLIEPLESGAEQFPSFIQNVHTLQTLKPGGGADGWTQQLRKGGVPAWCIPLFDGHLKYITDYQSWLVYLIQDYGHRENGLFRQDLANAKSAEISRGDNFGIGTPYK